MIHELKGAKPWHISKKSVFTKHFTKTADKSRQSATYTEYLFKKTLSKLLKPYEALKDAQKSWYTPLDLSKNQGELQIVFGFT